MLRALQNIFQYGQTEAPALGADVEDHAPQAPELLPFDGFSVPDEVTREPSDTQIYVYFFERLIVAPGQEPNTVVVFPDYLGSEKDPEHIRIPVRPSELDEIEEVEHRLDCTRRIYERIFAEEQAKHQRIVSYLGPTSTGYKLERLFPGPLVDVVSGLEPAHTSANLLALYQRWALQLLSALAFLHSKNVVLNAMSDEILWMRDDLSIAVAGLAAASCSDLEISVGPEPATNDIGNPWADTGSAKSDLFDWATWVYGQMTGADPVQHGMDDLDITAKGLAMGEREKQIRHREFDDWPQVEDRMLGSVVVRAWRGEYASADEALLDARKLLEINGTRLSTEQSDELAGIEWQRVFAVDRLTDKDGFRRFLLREELQNA